MLATKRLLKATRSSKPLGHCTYTVHCMSIIGTNLQLFLKVAAFGHSDHWQKLQGQRAFCLESATVSSWVCCRHHIWHIQPSFQQLPGFLDSLLANLMAGTALSSKSSMGRLLSSHFHWSFGRCGKFLATVQMPWPATADCQCVSCTQHTWVMVHVVHVGHTLH